MRILPCVASQELGTYLKEQDTIECGIDAAEKRLNEIAEMTLQDIDYAIRAASHDNKRPASHRAKCRALTSSLEDLMAEIAGYI